MPLLHMQRQAVALSLALEEEQKRLATDKASKTGPAAEPSPSSSGESWFVYFLLHARTHACMHTRMHTHTCACTCVYTRKHLH
jgi:hypothetical protein